MGKFICGHTKVGGRAKGVQNKRSEILRDVLEGLGCDVPTKLVTLLPQLNPDRQVDVLLSLLPYLYPKRGVVEDIAMVPVETGLRSQLQKVFADPETMKVARLPTLMSNQVFAQGNTQP